MGFAWTEDISLKASIDATDITEVRTNVDTVDDEMCAGDKVSYDNDYKDGDCGPDNPGYFSNEHGTYNDGQLVDYDNGDLVGHDATYNPGYLNDDHGDYENGDDSGALDLHNPGYQNDYHSDYRDSQNVLANVPD